MNINIHVSTNYSRTNYLKFVAALFSLFLFTPFAGAQERVPGDRWMEIDLYWFKQNQIQQSVDEFWKRFAPIYQDVQGDRGLILNVGWTVQFIMDWSGNLDQRIVLPSGSGQQPWVAETSPLKGDWAQMHAEWQKRFEHPVLVERHGYQPWTYRDLKVLADALRATGVRYGVSGFKVGALTYGWKNAYGEVMPWMKLHPEVFTPVPVIGEGVFNPSAKLHADHTRLGGLPDGIPEGMAAHEAFAVQWGSLSKAAGLDAIMLRDSFGMLVPYARNGPFGSLAPNPETARRYNASVAALVRETKQANPQALVMMYSNGASAISDWRSNCFDLETIAKEGYLDIFVDQTWAGSWNEVGTRHNNFWNVPALGWTYQLAYMLMHSAILSETKVRHYPLVETFDAWESWDVLHTVPERLRWGIWAYSHAAVVMPDGLKMPAGSYISWANQGERLLSEQDVQFLRSNISAAVIDAHKTVQVFGPTLVYSRDAMQWQMDHASASNDIKEWIDEQAGSVMKWPVPILSATRAEWLPRVHSDLFIVQTPVNLDHSQTKAIAKLIADGQPIALFGSTVNGIDKELARSAGLNGVQAVDKSDSQHNATASAYAANFIRGLPQEFPTRTALNVNRISSGATAIYSVEDSPALAVNTTGGKRVVVWDPPTFQVESDKPLLETWGNSVAPYALTAGALNHLLSISGAVHASEIDGGQNMSGAAWRTSDGMYRLLAADLEEGLRNHADHARQARFAIPSTWEISGFEDVWQRRAATLMGLQLDVRLDHAQSILLISKH